MIVDALAVRSRAAPLDARPREASNERAEQHEFVTLLDSFCDAVRAGPAIPLTGLRLVDGDVCLALLSHLRAALPPKIVAAYTVQRDAEALVSRASVEARGRRSDSGSNLLDDHPVVRSALDRAERLQADTDHEADELRAGVDAYARACLGAVSQRLTRLAAAVERAEVALAVRDTERR